MSPEEDRTRDAVDSEPKRYQLSYSGPTLRVKQRDAGGVDDDTADDTDDKAFLMDLLALQKKNPIQL